jgi:hypothetical protein
MKNIKRFAFTFFALLTISGLAMAVPVSARDGESGDTATTSSSNSGSGENPSSETGDNIKVHNLANSLKRQGEAEVQAQKGASHKTEADRQKSCAARKNSLTKRMANSVAQAKKHKAVFDKIFVRVKDFHDTKKLNVPNYDALVAVADTASANAQSSIDALQSLDVSVDCTSQTVATSVSAFQQSVKNTRDSLKAYRAAIVDLIKAVKGASTSAGDNSSTNGSND